MTGWLTAFPIRPASEAVDALCESWHALAQVRRPGFNPKTREPDMTRCLKAYVEQVTARERGLLGMWVTEAVHNQIDLETAELIEERRTDIIYGWNSEQVGIQLVFEFKKLDARKNSRTRYLGDEGLGRFVTGTYSRGQSLAVMVGVLLVPEDQIVPPLCDELVEAATVLRLCFGPDGTALK